MSWTQYLALLHVRNHYLDLEFNEKKEGWKERKRDKVERG